MGNRFMKKVVPDRKRTMITFVIADLALAVILFLSCINLFLKAEWTAVQFVIIAIYVFISVFMLVLSLTRNFYVIEKKHLVAVRGTRVAYYEYNDVVYIDREQSERKKMLCFCTNKGITRYLPFDKDQEIYTTFLEKCHNLLDEEEFKRQYPKVKM